MKAFTKYLIKPMFTLSMFVMSFSNSYGQNNWTLVVPPFPGAIKSSPIYFTLNGKIYVGGGVNGDFKSLFLIRVSRQRRGL